jgi:hypothetical protein
MAPTRLGHAAYVGVLVTTLLLAGATSASVDVASDHRVRCQPG